MYDPQLFYDSALSSISNGVIHPGLSSGRNLGLEILKILAGKSCVAGSGSFAGLVCAILSCSYSCSPPFKSLVPLLYVGFWPSDDISRCGSDVEDWWCVGTSELEPGRERMYPEVDGEGLTETTWSWLEGILDSRRLVSWRKDGLCISRGNFRGWESGLYFQVRCMCGAYDDHNANKDDRTGEYPVVRTVGNRHVLVWQPRC